MLIRGVVHSSGGAVLEGAVVAFVDAPVDMPDVAAVTGDDGTFVVAAPAPGRYRISLRADGHRRQELVVDVTGDVEVQATLNRG